MIPYLQTDRVTLYHARAEDVYPILEPGFSLAILDGPYNLRKAPWDCFKTWSAFLDFYRPHLAEVTRLCAPSASLYVWGTAESEGYLRDLIRGFGWVFRGIIVWHKTGANPALLTASKAEKWPDVIEVCAHYQRGDAYHVNPGGGNVWEVDSTNEMRNGERIFTDETIRRPSGHGRYYDCRAALHPLACHRLPPEEARQCVSIEMDAKYLEAVRGCFTLDPTPRQPGQVGLFG